MAVLHDLTKTAFIVTTGMETPGMSPDQYYYQKRLTQAAKRLDSFSKGFPNLLAFLDSPSGDFRGLTLTLGGRGDWLLILKRFGGDGGPEVQFWGGDSPLECLLAAEEGMADRTWKEDKWKSKD